MVQFIRFLRRTMGVEAARKYFLDARKLPNCTYHVYVAYATMAFCLDKDPKIAHNVFEAGLKRFMHEPAYILEYADFLARLNDDRNIRALSSLPLEESVEVWKRFTHFEQTFGDLACMLKVEKRRKEALSQTGEEGLSALECSLQDVVSRYSFKDLWPCSSKDLDHLSRQEWLSKNINKNSDKLALLSGPGFSDSSTGLISNSDASTKIVCPDTSQMMVYDPSQKSGTGVFTTATVPGVAVNSSTLPNPAMVGGGPTNTALDEILKITPPALVAFLANLPAVDGPTPDVDVILSICLQSNIPVVQSGKSGIASTHVPVTSELSASSKSHGIPNSSFNKSTRDRRPGKRKDLDREENDETTSIQSQPLPRDVFRIRQIQKARGATSSQTGSVSYGSAVSGDLSGSTG